MWGWKELLCLLLSHTKELFNREVEDVMIWEAHHFRFPSNTVLEDVHWNVTFSKYISELHASSDWIPHGPDRTKKVLCPTSLIQCQHIWPKLCFTCCLTRHSTARKSTIACYSDDLPANFIFIKSHFLLHHAMISSDSLSLLFAET